MWGIFGRDINLHQPLLRGMEGVSDGAGVAIQSPRTILPPDPPGVDENPFTGIRSLKVFGNKMFSVCQCLAASCP